MTTKQTTTPRRGSIALMALILLPVLFLAVVLGLHGIELRAVQTEMQNACDSAALAAGKELVDDIFLCCDEEALKPIVKRSHDRAQELAAANLVLAKPLELLDNPTNNPEGDIVYGRFNLKEKTLAPVGESDDWCTVDAVAIVGRRTQERKNPAMLLKGPFLHRSPVDVKVLSVAYLDRGVIGFRPVHDTLIPLMPIALQEHPSRPGEPWSFDDDGHPGRGHGKGKGHDGDDGEPREHGEGKGHTIGKGKGHDHEDDDDHHGGKGCGKRRWKVRIGHEQAGAALLQLGAEDADDLLRQMILGISAADLKGFGGELILNEDGVRPVGGAARLARGGSLCDRLMMAAHALRGKVRFWPLYRGGDGEKLLLKGFVAATIVSVSQSEEGLELELRATFASSPTVVVASTRPEWKGEARRNPYICKVRLAR